MSLQKTYVNFAAPGEGTVGVATATLVPANTQRGYLIIFNNSDVAIALGLNGNDAVVGKGVVLQPFDSYEMVNGSVNLDGGAVSAIAPAAGKSVSFQEGDVVQS